MAQTRAPPPTAPPSAPPPPPPPLCPQDDAFWRQLAEQKWGKHVQKLAKVAPGGWAAWTRHRLTSRSRPISPLDLVQVRSWLGLEWMCGWVV